MDEGGTFGGPCKALLQALRAASAELLPCGTFRHRAPNNEMKEVKYMGSDTKNFEHELRDALRGEEWLNLSDRRPSFEGIEYGIDRSATNVLSGKTAGLTTHRLRCVLTGAVATCHRLHRIRTLEDPHCRCCGHPDETLEHITDECPAFEQLRAQVATPDEWEELPVCLRRHGIMPAWQFPMPSRYAENQEDDRKALAADMQYLLTDMVEMRMQHMPELAGPCPRWHRNVRPRLG